MKNRAFALPRLSPDPHHFGTGVIGDSIVDPDSDKGDLYCEVLEYEQFERAGPNKDGDDYLETIPETRRTNYWRFGVREISEATYRRILTRAKIKGYVRLLPSENGELESLQRSDGKEKKRFSTYYERKPFHRKKAIEIHGLTCMACQFDFESRYGERGRGYIHVHHNKPISETGPTKINPRTDLSVLCPNCHAMVHRKKSQTLSIDEVKDLIREASAT
jgi:predicted HNH restriction endonuclease